MALIRLGGLVTAISGKIGGQTLGTSASGSYMKNSGTPRKTITLLQRSKMAQMASTAQKWRGLTDGERAVFTSASSSYPYLNRVGETKYYTGYQIFCKLTRNFENAFSSGLAVPLPLVSFNLFTSSQILKSLGNYMLTATGGTVGISYRLFVSRPASKGVTQGYKNKFYIGDYTSANLSTGVNITTALTDKFGVIATGSRMYWKIKAVSTLTGQEFDNIASGRVDS